MPGRLLRACCCAALIWSTATAVAVVEVNIVDQGNKPLADAVVVMQPVAASLAGKKAQRAVIAQIDR